MMPCIKASYLKRILPLLEPAQTGWGLDFGWAATNWTSKAGIIDSVPMRHTRPIGKGSVYTALRNAGLPSPRQEFVLHCASFGVVPRHPHCTQGETVKGKRTTSRLKIAWDTFICAAKHRKPMLGFRQLAKGLLSILFRYNGPSLLNRAQKNL